MVEVRAMNLADASRLEDMMKAEDSAYMHYFLAFNEKGELTRQCLTAVKDAFYSIVYENEIAGFFCLRGLDSGYICPSFGVYVSSLFQGRGLGKMALEEALKWCGERGISKILLKVAEENSNAYRLYKSMGFVSHGCCPDTGHIVMERGVE